MTTNNGTQSNGDDIADLINELYHALMVRRFGLMELRRQKWKRPDKDKAREEIDELEERINDQQKDFDSILKSHTQYVKFNKATGKTDINQNEELRKMIAQQKSNMGDIVQQVPKI